MGGYRDDRALVRRLLEGDERAFEEFSDDVLPRLHRFALARVGRNPEAAEEVVQEMLLRVVPRLHTYRGEAALFTWLCTFVRRVIAERFRHLSRRPAEVELAESGLEIREALRRLQGERAGDPEAGLLDGEVAQLVREALDRLPGRYGDALEWKYVEGLSVEEIGSRLEIGTTAAQSLLARARRAFRDGFSAQLAEPLAVERDVVRA